MKFKIRYADKLVGVLVIAALVSIIFVVFLLGKTQRWFSKSYSYVTYAVTASGLSRNMPVSCRGIPIGNVKSFDLTDDNRIEVIFAIQGQFNDRAKIGSLIEVQVSPIGFGAQFIYYPGLGMGLQEGELVPMRDSPEGRAYIAQGLAYIPPTDDLIGSLVSQAVAVFDELQKTLDGLNVGSNEKAATALGQNIVNLQQLTATLAEPDGVRKLLNSDGELFDSLETSIVSLSGILRNLDRTTAYLPREMPQVISMIAEARSAIQSANDVLVGLSNNPLLKKGIPEHAEVDSSGTNPRNIRF